MTDCKHDWHFVDDTMALKCRRCGEVTGPRTYEERVQDILEYDTTHFYMPTGQLQIAEVKPDYNISFHRVVDGRNGDVVGKLDFNGPELVFTGDADESAKVFIDWVATSFHGRLKEEREAGRQEALANRPAQVSPLEFVTMTLEKEHLIGKPMIWAEWPNKEIT